MLTKCLFDVLSSLFQGRTAGRTVKRRGSKSRVVECLEARQVLATATWDGGDLDDSLWTSPNNWVGDVAPTAGDDLVFASSASRLTNANDFAASPSRIFSAAARQSSVGSPSVMRKIHGRK